MSSACMIRGAVMLGVLLLAAAPRDIQAQSGRGAYLVLPAEFEHGQALFAIHRAAASHGADVVVVNPEHATVETIAAAIRLVNRVRQDRPQVDRAHAIVVSGLAPYRGRRLEGVERAKASSATAQLLQGAPTRGLAAGMPRGRWLSISSLLGG